MWWCIALVGNVCPRLNLLLFQGSTYNIPVAVYLVDTHPYYAPMCYVCPTPNMMVKESKTVDKLGRIYLPYLSDWRYPGYDLNGLLQVCFRGFSVFQNTI